MRADLQVVGFAQTLPRRIAASVTRYEVGEPLYSDSTLSSGVDTDGSNVAANTWELPAEDFLTIGTHRFGGIAISHCLPFSTGTVVAHTAQASCPIPNIGRIRGKGETAANWDTDSEILGFIGDVTHIDYNATGGSDGGELYTIKTAAGTPADTAGFEICEGNAAKQTVDVLVDFRCYRHDVAS